MKNSSALPPLGFHDMIDLPAGTIVYKTIDALILTNR